MPILRVKKIREVAYDKDTGEVKDKELIIGESKK